MNRHTNTVKTLRSGLALNTALIAAAASAVFLGSYEAVTYRTDTRDDAAVAAGDDAAAVTGPALAAFTSAQPGSCLMWDLNDKGAAVNFQEVDCASEHRFEVSSREDLSIYPTSEFSSDAPLPNLERQAQLREELCQGDTLNYLDGKFDPSGRYSIAPILPPDKAWAAGDRTMLCGLQTTNEQGVPQVTTGRVLEVDQANIAAPGQCRRVTDNQVLRDVPCADPHQLETVSVVNLLEQFPRAFPTPDEQNTFLAQRCTQDAEDYLGGEEALYQSTLQPYWGVVSESSWAGGTHSVNCSLVRANSEGSFAALTGTAKDGREKLTVDGQVPAAPATRNPLRSEVASAAPSAPARASEPAAPVAP